MVGARYAEIAVTAITPNPRQPRRSFDEDALDELAESIRQVGLLQPVVVRAVGPGRYELVMGERRWRAAQRAGLSEIGAIVKQTQDNDLLRDALIENLHRQQLDPLEEAAAYQQLLDDFGATHEELARKIGRSRPHISNTLRLLNLPPGRPEARRGRCPVCRPRPGAAEPGGCRGAGAPGHQGRRRGPVGPGRRGDRRRRLRRVAAAPLGAHRGQQPTAPGLRRLADRLSDLFETRVKVELGRNKGKIVVEFATFDDLQRIVQAMTPAAFEQESAD